MTGTVLFDNEAVQALRAPDHAKHRRALSYVQVVAVRKRKARRTAEVLVPTAVRVEAGWDRSDPRAAFVNLLGIRDAPLHRDVADGAAAIAVEHRVSVADAHLGAVARRLPGSAGPVTIVTSDAEDMRRAAGTTPVSIVTL